MQNVTLHSFNRGIISPLALARIDIQRTRFSAETMTNWIARVLGSMMLRPGTKYIGSSDGENVANYLEFVFSTSDKALIEVVVGAIKVWISDALVTRPSVTTAVQNGNFASNLNSWTDADEAGATSVHVASGGDGFMGLTGNGTAAAIRTQILTIAAGDQNVEHALDIVIERGPAVFKCGSSAGADDYISETTLGTGYHSLAFTPTGASVHLRFENRLKRQVLVDSCNIDTPGAMGVTTGAWTLDADKDNLRVDQSGDILYVACAGYQPRKIERRGTRSWSVVKYEPEDGPFRAINTGVITMTAGALSGNTTLTASATFFRSGHVGALFKLTSEGQAVSANIAAENTFTNSIRVTGVGSARGFTVSLTGTWSATVTLQRSLDEGTSWIDVTTYTANTSTTYLDGLDNQIILYRIGVKTGNYTSGTVAASLSITTGSITGICRVTSFTSATVVNIEIIEDFGGTSATDLWYEGEWSSYRGFPTAVEIVEGRLAWAGKNGVWFSVSDEFESFDDRVTGDSGPISRTIGSGPVDTISWIIALQRMIIGAQGAEFVCKSSAEDQPLTPTDFSIKPVSTQGSSNVEAAKLDKIGVYVQRGGVRVMQLAKEDDFEYGSSDLTLLCPEVTSAGVKRIAIQRQPDTRIHCVLDDGTAAIAVLDRLEDVLCWVKFTTDGTVEDVAILPGDEGEAEDKVYYHVKRTINGATKRYLEKWALESDCAGSTLNKQADSFLEYSGGATTTITGLSHLEAKSVVVWGNGKSLGTYTVSSGQITGISEAVTSAIVGLSYTAQWKSTKLAYVADSLLQKKRIPMLGVILRNTHYQGLKFGPDFDTLDDLPARENETDVSANTVHSTYDEESFTFPGRWDTDARLCLQAQAPKPCTILAAVVGIETHEKA